MNKESKLKAFIFDLDGVITLTQKLHKKAWLIMLNDFLKTRERELQKAEENLEGFRTWDDYNLYLDGIPREKGIRNFLESRKIFLSDEEIFRLGIRKNLIYLSLLDSYGPSLVENSQSFIFQLREKKIPMAIVSSSRNCRLILEQVGLIDCFDVIIDPHEVNSLKLKGKPEPDYFFEAARRLNVSPGECFLVEDALSGIKAGRNGNFGRVIGIKVSGDQEELVKLKNAGADEVVTSLWDIKNADKLIELPNALLFSSNIFSQSDKFFLFMDFDTTICPASNDSYDTSFLENIKELIESISEYLPICIISGKYTQMIKMIIKDTFTYTAGCHEFDIIGPQDVSFMMDKECLTISSLEPLPDIDWDKGRALLKLYEVLMLDRKFYPALYFGGEKTNEEAFKVLRKNDIPILVSEKIRPTFAKFHIKGPEEIKKFLELLLGHLEGR